MRNRFGQEDRGRAFRMYSRMASPTSRCRRIFLRASAFGVVHRERLRAPVEVAQQQTRYLPAAQSVNRQQEQDGSGAQRGGAISLYTS